MNTFLDEVGEGRIGAKAKSWRTPMADSVLSRLHSQLKIGIGRCALGFAIAALSSYCSAQAIPAASRIGDIQVGVGYTRAQPDYSPSTFTGFAIYADADLLARLGVEADFHRSSGLSPTKLSETTYEFGGRYRYPIGPFSPYVKLMFGAGSFSFGSSTQNGTYAIYSGGGGLDFMLLRNVVLRADYEYQRWGGFPPRGLQPNLFTAGVAYRFH